MSDQTEADLPPNLACLKNVDTLLRCPICFDFLNISVMTKCSHNFCSLCIRKFLSYKLQCPVCNTQATEQDLRNNRLLDDLVVSFQAARQQLSKVTFESPPISPKTPASAVKCKTPREKGQKNNSVVCHIFQKRPKKSPTAEGRQDSFVSQYMGTQHTGRSHNANGVIQHSSPNPLSVVVNEELVDKAEASIQVFTSVKQEDTGSHSISAANEIAHSSIPLTDVKPIIKVECPVCSVSVSQQFINNHLDTCLTREEKKESLRSSICKKRRPMAKLVYNLLSLQELKRRLKDCHMSTKGSRDQLIKRHQEFIHIYNSQCDSLNPKSAQDIAKEVEGNEKMRNQLQGKTKPVMVFSKNQPEEEIDEMHSNYRKQHGSEFSRLIAQVRGRLETTKKAHIKHEEEDTQTIHTAVSEPKRCRTIKVEEEEGDTNEEPSARSFELSPSPTNSEISISSSISDIFGPEPDRNLEEMERPSLKRQASGSRGEVAESSPAVGKRRRKK